tara:strand:+ start:4440 stop:5099 length:660 start_codon:yes stop_codon:yes gene_type:complete
MGFNLFKPFVTLGKVVDAILPGDPIQDLIDAHTPSTPKPLARNNGYVLITNKGNPSQSYLGRNLEFDSNRGFMGRGAPERVMLDGHVIWETQIRNTSIGRLRNAFFDTFNIESLSHAQVADTLAEEDDDPTMFGDTAMMDQMMEDQLEELREELEEEYAEQFEEDYQERFTQEYPGHFSKDFTKHYTDFVDDELDDAVESHEELYNEYIVTDKHIRYKR